MTMESSTTARSLPVQQAQNPQNAQNAATRSFDTLLVETSSSD
jgi:hypothetical protein